ncbi:unnamed protein product [Gordionus sp. m RMFG-2023]|uniref:troponin C-like n=1 Tax=Gordionus sp. m RMFG-2023 TaxID=3053472 RepID=UPI0030DF4929
MTDLGFNKHQVAEYRKAFSQFDKEGKGEIPTSNLAMALKVLGHSFAPSDLREMIREFDPGNSGKLDFDDFCMIVAKWVLDQDTGAEEELREAFRLYDKESNGYIKVSDLRDLLRAIDENISEQELDQMIKEIDSDSSGTVDYDEFMEMMGAKKKN